MSDLIDRQAAIDAVKMGALSAATIYGRTDEGSAALYETVRAIKALPSAQPDIIRCTECKHYREYDSEYVENAVVVQCMADRYPISETIPDGWFCAGAERRTDEQ